MRSIFTVATIVASVLLLTGAANLASAEDDAEARDLTLEQLHIFKARPAKQSSLQVTASVDRADRTYAKGETVKLHIKVNEDAHVLVFDKGPTGNLIKLFPNQLQKDDLIKAGHTVSIPPSDSKVKIKVAGDTGAEVLKVVASTKPIDLASGAVVSGDDVFMTVKEGAEEFAKDLTLATENPEPDQKFAVFEMKLKTVPSR
jgi:hypothetical protein